MQNPALVAGAAILVVVVIGGAWYLSRSTSPTPLANPTATSTSTGSVASTTTATKKPNTLAISSKDSITSWSFNGPYKDGGALEQKANGQIMTLKSQIDEANPQVQITYIGIAEQYELLGDGKAAYDYYLKALNSSQRYQQPDAIAWSRLAGLMEKLGANYTAITAYTSAVKALPGEPSFHVARISFLLSEFPKETALITAAFADADKGVPGDASVAQLRLQFKNSQ